MADDREFFRLERRDTDLPFYRGVPVRLGAGAWIAVLAGVAAGFAALLLVQPALHEGLAGFVPPLLFVFIPLIVLRLVGGPEAPRALFRRLRASDILIVLVIYVLNWVVTIFVGAINISLFDAAANPAGDLVASQSGVDQALFFGWTAVSLFAEELLTILVFLAGLAAFDGRMGRKPAMALAALIASIAFAMIHLPTYQWNLPQALVGLIPIRLVLLAPYIITRNIWVSAAAHILNDWTIFGMSVIAASGLIET